MKKIRDISIINFVLLFYLSCVNQLYASNIQLDGTLGSAGNIELQGPEYKIKAEFGEQSGSNLFHSFHSFNLQSKETAIFQGPPIFQIYSAGLQVVRRHISMEPSHLTFKAQICIS